MTHAPALVMPEMDQSPVAFLPASLAEEKQGRSFVVIIRTKEELGRWLECNAPGLQWLQVEDLLPDPEAWVLAAQGTSNVPLDVIVSDPATQYGSLYRLANVRLTRPVRVTVPATAGMLPSLRLAASLQLPVRILPGQPTAEGLAELEKAAAFYLHDPSVESPMEFFHSFVGAMAGSHGGSLWEILEKDPTMFAHMECPGDAPLPRDFVQAHLQDLVGGGAECASCPWVTQCAGYFKWPDATYDCSGVKSLFSTLQAAAGEMSRDLAAMAGSSELLSR